MLNETSSYLMGSSLGPIFIPNAVAQTVLSIISPIILSCIVGVGLLVFSAIIFIKLLSYLKDGQLDSAHKTTIIIIALVVITSMFAVVLNSSTSVVSSVVTLLGTIIGFLLGRLVEVSKNAARRSAEE